MMLAMAKPKRYKMTIDLVGTVDNRTIVIIVREDQRWVITSK